MSVVIRYFAVSGAGAADGTSHANRAALFSAGNWSTVITGFAFNGTDGMEARVEAGTHTCGQALASGIFTNAPSTANPLVFVGADTSGNILAVPNPKWRSCQPAYDISTFPVINTTTNIASVNLANALFNLISFTASGRTGGGTVVNGQYFWCSIANSTANTAATACTASNRLTNCVLSCTGSSYDTVYIGAICTVENCRFEGISTASSGNRRGLTGQGQTTTVDGCTIVNNPGIGVLTTSAIAGQTILLRHCVVANNGSDGVQSNTTASQTEWSQAINCMITGNTGWGVNSNTAAGRWEVIQSRFRNNSGGDMTIGNYPTDMNVYTTAATDADEYVSTGANGDFTIKNTATIWGSGYGVAEQAAASAGGGGFFIQ